MDVTVKQEDYILKKINVLIRNEYLKQEVFHGAKNYEIQKK